MIRSHALLMTLQETVNEHPSRALLQPSSDKDDKDDKDV
jgi:hypothetical protein